MTTFRAILLKFLNHVTSERSHSGQSERSLQRKHHFPKCSSHCKPTKPTDGVFNYLRMNHGVLSSLSSITTIIFWQLHISCFIMTTCFFNHNENYFRTMARYLATMLRTIVILFSQKTKITFFCLYDYLVFTGTICFQVKLAPNISTCPFHCSFIYLVSCLSHTGNEKTNKKRHIHISERGFLLRQSE